MSPARLTVAYVDPNNVGSASARARARRWMRFVQAFPAIAEMRVLDLGGRPSFWRSAPVRPAHVVTLNLEDRVADEPWMTHRRGDACAPPTDVLAGDFDLVVSNSVLEHVGGHAQRQRLVEVVERAAPLHWVQTPYRYFPIEPHWLFPGFQFLPFATRVAITRTWPLGHMRAESPGCAVANVHEVELIGVRQMRSYFPTSTIWLERFAAVPKSLVAIEAGTDVGRAV